MSRKRSISAILSVTLAPPSTTTSGRSGASTIERSVTTSRSSSRPATAGRRCSATPDRRGVRAVRGAEGVVHVDVGRARPARAPARGRSSSRPAPSACSRARARSPGSSSLGHPRRTSGPTTSGAWCTGASISSPSRSDTGASEVSGSRPFGRPRCEQSTSRAPRSSSSSIVGSAARMRASSVTRPSVERHVEVHAHEHRPARVDVEVADGPLAEHLEAAPRRPAPREDALRQVDHAVRVAPLVVVPGHDLHQPLVDRPSSAARRRPTSRATPTMSVETIGSSVYLRMPSSGPLSACSANAALTSSALVSRRHLAHQVHHRAGDHRRAHGDAVQLAVQLGDHQADRLGGAGRGGDQVDRGGAGAAQVLVRARPAGAGPRCRRGSWS